MDVRAANGGGQVNAAASDLINWYHKLRCAGNSLWDFGLHNFVFVLCVVWRRERLEWRRRAARRLNVWSSLRGKDQRLRSPAFAQFYENEGSLNTRHENVYKRDFKGGKMQKKSSSVMLKSACSSAGQERLNDAFWRDGALQRHGPPPEFIVSIIYTKQSSPLRYMEGETSKL